MEELKTQCVQELLELRDSFDALSSKWKLPILQYLYNRRKEVNHFSKIARGVTGISDKMLTKALKELHSNHLVEHTEDKFSANIAYGISAHGETAIPLIKTIVEWGRKHREITKKMY